MIIVPARRLVWQGKSVNRTFPFVFDFARDISLVLPGGWQPPGCPIWRSFGPKKPFLTLLRLQDYFFPGDPDRTARQPPVVGHDLAVISSKIKRGSKKSEMLTIFNIVAIFISYRRGGELLVVHEESMIISVIALVKDHHVELELMRMAWRL